MLDLTKKHMLLLSVFVFSFIFRMLLMLWETFPSGADIGLHNSVIYSITGSTHPNFLWNFYQIGGGLSLTFPGYHIFAAGVMMMTGLPEYVAHAVIVSFFSSLIVLCSFLITKSVWGESAAFIVAFLVSISRFDIEMLLWGGYPNVITLFLIPLIFYLYLQRDRFSTTPFLVSTSVLAASIFLTHSLSAAIFVGVVSITVLFALVFPKSLGTSRKTGLYWLVPIALGVILVSPFLINAVPAYLTQNSSAPGVQDVDDITSAILSTRILPLTWVIPLFGILAGFAVFSKKYRGRFFSLPAFLLSMWLFVPLLLTQGYLFGFIIDYNRFLYFLILPAIIFIAVLIDHGSGFFARTIHTYRTLTRQLQMATKTAHKKIAWVSVHLTRKALYGGFVLFFLLFSFVALPIFLTPMQGRAVQSFYQVMNYPGFDAITWAKKNTPVGSLFVSDALYGWWFSGFAQRPTLSAVDPQYLTLPRELNGTRFAKNLLDTDYVIDNGYIQVREDGGYTGRHNPMFLADLNWTYFPYSFFQFNNSEIFLLSRKGDTVQSTDITQIPVTSMQLVGRETDSPSIVINKANSDFKFSEILTVSKGVTFANMTVVIQSNGDVSLDWVNFILNSQGKFEEPIGNTVAMLDVGMKEVGQLIFAKNQPQNIISLNSEYPCITELSYNLQGHSMAEIQILVGLYPVAETDMESQENINNVITSKVQTAQEPNANLNIFTFDYHSDMQAYGVSYIANRDFELNQKFACDPSFSLVFINAEVAIFKVEENLSQNG